MRANSILFLIISTTLISSCEVPIDIKLNSRKNHQKNIHLKILTNSQFTLSKGQKEICFNHHPDSLSTNSPLQKFELIDLNNNLRLIKWHQFLGRIYVNKKSNNKYEFIGRASFPDNGDWSQGFIERTTIKYILDIADEGYTIQQENSQRLCLDYDKGQLLALKNYIYGHLECSSGDSQTANQCLQQIKRYEYHLFASLLDGDHSLIKEYLSLRETIPRINTGAFSEYYEGNILLLALYGIVSERDHDLFRIKTNLSHNSNQVHCY